MPQACVLVADISGSTHLFEKKGNEVALQYVSQTLEQMRFVISDAGGTFIRSKGDDVLALFEDADAALKAACMMVDRNWDELAVHAGMYYGDFVDQNQDIFGQAVNTAARLADMAKPGEVLLGDSCYVRLKPASQVLLVGLGVKSLKGMEVGIDVFSYTAGALHNRTIFVPIQPSQGDTKLALLQYGHREWTIREGEPLTIGRASECSIVVAQPWVSRHHSTLQMSNGHLEYNDHSSTGSIVQTEAGQDFLIHRKTMLLTGNGTILLGANSAPRTASAIRFDTNTKGRNHGG